MKPLGAIGRLLLSGAFVIGLMIAARFLGKLEWTVLVFLGLLGIFKGMLPFWTLLRARTWLKAAGTVLDSRVESYLVILTLIPDEFFYPEVKVRYFANGGHREATTYGVMPRDFCGLDKSRADELVAPLQPGALTDVFYSPSRPDRAALRRELSSRLQVRSWAYLGFGLVLVGLGSWVGMARQ